MIIDRKALPRRAVLRGMGASLTLPLLDAMIPALTAQTKSAANAVKRLGVVYAPNGIQEAQWKPAIAGAGFEITPILKPLEPFREQMLVLDGIDNSAAMPRSGELLGAHSRPAAAFLTGMHAKRTTGSALSLGVSMDQVAAEFLGRETQLPSLELSLEGTDTVNGVSACDTGYSCAYLNISWRNTTTPMPRETNPRVVFERLFGDAGTTDAAVRRSRVRKQSSILDEVLQKTERLQQRLGAGDRLKVNEYLDSVRDVERRLQTAETQAERDLPAMESPAGIPVSYEEHTKLMYDLLLLGYQTDSTRVFSFMLGREQSGTTYPQIGVPDSHHPISHHQNNPERMARLVKINAYHTTLFSQFVQRLKATPDGDGSLLDHMVMLYGASLRDSNSHLYDNLNLLVIGGGSGALKGGRHIVFPKSTPMTNLHMTLLDKVGVPLERFGEDSTGRLRELSELA